jgi:hypothetical protein
VEPLRFQRMNDGVLATGLKLGGRVLWYPARVVMA